LPEAVPEDRKQRKTTENKEASDVYTVIAIVLAYMLGSISFAVVVSKVFGLADPRSYGSHNPGATNVLRSGNRIAAGLTLLLDGLKGWLAVWLALTFGFEYGIGEAGVALVAVAVFLGHLYPVFFRFKGGKGVATFMGLLFALNVWLGIATAATWIIIAVFLRYSSLAAMVSALFAPFYYLLLFGADSIVGALVVISGLLLYRHRGNMVKLMTGKESRLGEKKGTQKGTQKEAHKEAHKETRKEVRR